MSKGSFRDRLRTGGSRPPTMGTRPKHFYCTIFGQMDRSQSNLAVVLRTYFYPKEEFTGNMKSVEERWDENPGFKIICNHEVNSDPPSVMLCNPVSVKAKPGAQFRIDLLNQEAFLDTTEFFRDGPQQPKCLQFDVSLESYNINTATSESSSEQIPTIKIIRSPDETQVATIPLVHLCDIPDAAMTGSFAFDDFCYTIDSSPRFGIKCEHNRAWHRLPQLLVKFLSEDRAMASKVMEIAKEWEQHGGLQLIHIPKDANRDAQIRIKFSSRNQSAIGTDAEDIPDDNATMYLNVSRDTHPVLFRRRILHQFGHALGLHHEFETLPESVEWDEASVQLDTSMEAGWTTNQTKSHVFNKESCSNNDNFDRMSIMTQTFKRSYIKGWLPRQHQSVLSVDDKALVKHLYPLPIETHQWADPMASPEPLAYSEEEEESEEESEEEEMTEWKKAAIEREREDGTPIDMFSGVFADNAYATGETFSDSMHPPTPPGSEEGRRHRSQHGASDHKRVLRMRSTETAGVEYEPTADGKKVIRGGPDGKRFLQYEQPRYTKEEIDADTRDGDFFSFRDRAVIRDMELPRDDRLPTPLFSPPDTPDSIPDSLAASPVSKLFLSDTFLGIREDWLLADQEHMIILTQESVPGIRRQKLQLHPGDIRYRDIDNSTDFRGEKIQEDSYGQRHQEKDLFGERTNVVSPAGIVEREHFYKTLNRLSTGETQETFAEKMSKLHAEKNKQEEFFQPEKKFVGDDDIRGMGFDAPKVTYRKSVEYEPEHKPKKGKGKGKKSQKLKSVKEADESFYSKAHKKAQQETASVEPHVSFREQLRYREGVKAPIAAGLAELKPADEDIFELLDKCQSESHHMGRGKFIPSNKAPALISTKGSFAGIGGSGSFRESGWQYYDYAEDDMMAYEYQEKVEDENMDLMTFRQRLQERSGIAVHEGVVISPARNDTRNYLESPVPVANRTKVTEERISKKKKKHLGGRYYDDGVDLVSPNNLVEEALDRGFKVGEEGDSQDEISREKREAARKYYDIHQSGSEDDDVTKTKKRNKADKKDKELSSKDRGCCSPDKDSGEDRRRYGFSHTVTNKPNEHHPEKEGKERKKSPASKKPRTSPQYSEASVEADLNWNVDRTHIKTQKKSTVSASALYDSTEKAEVQSGEEDPFLPPIMPKKNKPKSKAFVVSKEISTQITADALVPQYPSIGDFWINKDTIISRPDQDPYEDFTIKVPPQSSQKFYPEEERPATFRSTYTAYEPPSEAYEKPQFDALSDDDDDDDLNVYTRLSDNKSYLKETSATDVWIQKTDISFTVLLYLKKNLGINWKRAGQYLGVSRERLRRIEDVGIANARTGIEKMAQDMLFEWAEKDPQPTVAKLCAALEAADLSRLAQGVEDKVNKEKQPGRRKKGSKKGRGRGKVDTGVKVPVSEETIPYRVMVYLKDNLGESWKDVAVCLKIPSPRIKAIEADAWQVEKMAYDMMHEWRQREKEGATVDKLIEALEKAQCKKLVKGVQARSQSYHFRVSG